MNQEEEIENLKETLCAETMKCFCDDVEWDSEIYSASQFLFYRGKCPTHGKVVQIFRWNERDGFEVVQQ